MCGIAGILSLSGKEIDVKLLNAMTNIIRHRGPDDEGYLLVQRSSREFSNYSGKDSTIGVKARYPQLDYRQKAATGFGFRRLSILELAECGHQPMEDSKLNIAISFNGEIYNYLELRAELIQKGYEFFSNSDTEVIIKAYHSWGEACVSRFIGMWAFALWDGRNRKLFCSRDRYGIKPLYYTLDDDFLYWGSEIKQLLLIPRDYEQNTAMIWRSLKINSLLVYDDETYWKQIKCLKPGHNLSVIDGVVEIKEYYHLDTDGFESSSMSFNSAVSEYQALFLDAIALQVRSDVPVGASLSGGMDSSAIVCSATRKLAEPMHTYSSYFASTPELDERKWIDKIVSHSASISHLVTAEADDAIKWWTKATYINDLPIGAGFVSQYAVFQEANRNGTKVILSGQGSDEINAGYRHASYRYFADLIRGLHLGKLQKELPRYLKPEGGQSAFSKLAKIGLSFLLPESALYKLEFNLLRFEPFNKEFRTLATSQAEAGILSQIADIKASRLSNFLYNMMHNTSIQTLLHFEDRMSMANSVESRVPFLDNRLVDFVFQLPSRYKLQPPYNKLLHRKAMKPLIPDEIYARKDKGIFSSPFYAKWMRTGLKQYLNDILNSNQFRQRAVWDLPQINKQWQIYLSGNDKPAEMLYQVFALEHWFRNVDMGVHNEKSH